MNPLLFSARIKLANLQFCPSVDEVRQASSLILLLVEVQSEFSSVEDTVFEIVSELNGTEVARVDTELAEHTFSQVVLIVDEEAFFLTGLGVFPHFRFYRDSAVRACLFAHGARHAFVVAVLIPCEDEPTAVAFRDMQSCFSVFGVLFGNLFSEMLPKSDPEAYEQRLYACRSPFEI